MSSGSNRSSAFEWSGTRATVVAWVATTFAACGGGGSGGGSSNTPTVSVSFSQGATTIVEGASAATVSVVLHTTLSSLTTAASVDVQDAGTGTATSGSDYATFATQTITFPIGSVDGATQSVSLGALDDHLVEGATETVRLALASPTGTSATGTTTFVASITDVHTATVQFHASTSTTPDETTAARTITVDLDLAPGVTLGTAAVARVADLGGGSATVGVDYGTFAPFNVTFASGSADGASQNVTLQVIGDTNVEGDETVRFGLSQPASGTVLGSTTQHVVTIADDDAAGVPALAATSGTALSQSALAYDDQLSLGSQTVGAGPNTGTLVRVANTGGAAMGLEPPRVTGTNPNDFAVEIESSSMSTAAISSLPSVDAESALVAMPATNGPGVGVRLDAQQLEALRALPNARLQGFPVPGLGEVALNVRQVALPFAADAVLRVDGVDVPGGPKTLVGDLSLWSGTIEGLPGSRAFLAMTSSGPRGFLDLGFSQDRIVHVVPDAPVAGAPVTARVVREAEMESMGLGGPPELCGGELEVPGAPQVAQFASSVPVTAASITATDCRIAIETDYQLYQKFGSTNALTNYVTQLIAAVSDQYFQDVQTTLSIAYLGVYTTAGDPWTTQDSGGDSSSVLNAFRNAWAPNNWPASANLAHFISGANLGGGVAYVGVLCNSSYGFGVSGNINGNVNWGSWTGAPGNFTWDFVVVAHELGHNFGSAHTHAFCPPLDQCSTNCNSTTVCTRGTIMSYCHVCGGMSNIDLQFHPVCANVMRQTVNSSCLSSAGLPPGNWVQYLVRFNPLTTTGTKNAYLEFTHDATNVTNPFRVRLQGTAN